MLELGWHNLAAPWPSSAAILDGCKHVIGQHSIPVAGGQRPHANAFGYGEWLPNALHVYSWMA